MVNNAKFTAAAMCLIQNVRERNRDGFILELIFGVNPIWPPRRAITHVNADGHVEPLCQSVKWL